MTGVHGCLEKGKLVSACLSILPGCHSRLGTTAATDHTELNRGSSTLHIVTHAYGGSVQCVAQVCASKQLGGLTLAL